MAALSKDEIEEQDLRDPLHFAMASRDADVLTLVREALAAKRAKLAFQPIVTAGPQGCVAFYEGLIRVMDQSGRVIPAAQFMPVIEETDLGRQVDCVTLDLALNLLRKNRTYGCRSICLHGLSVMVNGGASWKKGSRKVGR
jgi:EAL domain-containing protein (putative c-di-GMP-specific phosphodiesterase class I)